MPNNLSTKLITLLSLFLFGIGITNIEAQNHAVNMVNGQNTVVSGCTYPVGTIYDNGGANGSYSNSFNGSVTITSTPGTTILLSGR